MHKKFLGISSVLILLFILMSFVVIILVSLSLFKKVNFTKEVYPIYIVNVADVYNKSQIAIKGKEHLVNVVHVLTNGVRQAERIYGNDGNHPSKEVMRLGIIQVENQYEKEIDKINKIVDDKFDKAVDKWLLAHEGSFVISSNYLLGYDKNIDITEDIISIMNDGVYTFSSLPTITVKPPSKEDDKNVVGSR